MIAQPDLGDKPKVKMEKALRGMKGMKAVDRVLVAVYAKAAADKYDGIFYTGGHKFDLQMQEDAFAFWDRWL
jgi:hypothetical protein